MIILRISLLVYEPVDIKKPYLYFGHVIEISLKCMSSKMELYHPSPKHKYMDRCFLVAHAPHLKLWGLDGMLSSKVTFVFAYK